MTEGEALALVQGYAAEHDVPWVDVARTQRRRAGWFGRVGGYTFELDTGGNGPAVAVVSVPLGVVQFEYRPTSPGRDWLPPWAAYPLYNSVTIGWKMGSGERYWIEWCAWFAGLPAARRAAYQRRYPPPDRDGWPGFYELHRATWDRVSGPAA